MSRIGKKPISLPDGVDVKIEKDKVTVKGKLGELSLYIDPGIKVENKDNNLIVRPVGNINGLRAKYGLYRSLLNNLVVGVSEGFSKTLKIVGVGYKAGVKGNNLELNVGYSNPVVFKKIPGIDFETPDNNTIIVKGIDKQLVGKIAADIREVRKPEPYKGKGIRYEDEYVRRKVGKAAITAAGVGK